MRNIKITFLFILLMIISVGNISATDIDTIKDLWEIRDGLGGDYTLTIGLNLEDTNPDIITEWATGSTYSVSKIIEHPTDGYAYYCTTEHTSTSTFENTKWKQLWQVSKGWKPIGTASAPFHGNFDGGGNIISNLYINRKADDQTNILILPPNGENSVGLFGYVTNGSTASNGDNNSDIYIKNLGLTDVIIKGKRGTGALIGKILLPNKKNKKKVYTENCYVSGGTVSGFGATGGLVGANNSDVKQTVPVIRYCYASVDVSSTHPQNQTINTGDNANPYNIKYGGLVGCNENGITQDSYATGNVSGGDRVGGLAGCSIGGAIFRCYATGNVTQGISSLAWEGGYGPITGKTSGMLPPGLGGTNATGSIEDSYYLSTATVIGTTDGNNYGNPQTSTELIAALAYSNWDSNVWDFTTDFPTLGTSPASIFYFQSKASGYFSASANWNSKATLGDSYTQSALKPDYTNSYSINIRSEDTITVTDGNSAFISATTLDGKLIVDSGANLFVENKTGDDLIVNGVLELKGALNIGASSTVAIDELISPTVKYLSWAGNSRNVISSAIETSNPTPALFPKYINRSWSIPGYIDSATTDDREKTITFYWNSTEDNGYDWVNLNSTPVLYVDGTELSGATSSDLSNDDRSATFTYTFPEYLTGYTGEFNIGLTGDNTLPVQLTTFAAFNQQGSIVKIQWITQSESSLDGYRLFRNNENSLDTSGMLDAFIPGTNTSQSHTYSHIDNTIPENGIYYYWIQMLDYDGSSSFYGPTIIEVEDNFNQSVDIPYPTGFFSIYPNPFNPTTSIRYFVELNTSVDIEIYNIKGQLVKNFDLGMQVKGFHSVTWNGTNKFGEKLPSGIYLTRMKANDKTDLRKILLLK